MRPSVKKLLLFGSTAPYSGAQLVLDFVGSRTSGQPYYMLNGVNYPSVSGVPGWTYTGGTAAGVGSYAAKADGSLQFFPSYTNTRTWTRAVENAAWVKRGTGSATASAIPSSDGTIAGSLLAGIGTAGVNDVYQLTQLTLPPSSSYAPSLWINRVSTSGVISLKNAEDATKGEWRIDLATLGSGWQYITRSHSAVTVVSEFSTTAAGLNGLHFTAFSGSPLSFYVDKIQTELGSTASTYIPTTTAAVTVGTPRITDAGYWAEEARTNLLLYSQAFTTGGWSNNIVYLTPNQSGAPDGTSTATLFTPPASAGSWDFRQSVTHTVASYTLSIYAKPNGYDRIAFRENTTSGSYVVASLTGAGSILSNSGGTSTITAVANGWYRLTMTWTGAAVSQQMSVYVVGPGYTSGSPNAYSWTPNGTSGVYFWGAQDELGSFATSPIPTTSVAVTRAADVGYVSGLVVPSAATLLGTTNFSTSVNTTSADQFVATLNDGTANNRRSMFKAVGGSSGRFRVSIGGVSYTPGDAFLDRAGIVTYALAWESGRDAGAADGTVGSAGTPPLATSPSILGVGLNEARTGSYTNNPIRRIVIYPRAFANSELQAITTAGAY